MHIAFVADFGTLSILSLIFNIMQKGNILLWVIIAVIAVVSGGVFLMRGSAPTVNAPIDGAASGDASESVDNVASDASMDVSASSAGASVPKTAPTGGSNCERLLTAAEIGAACGNPVIFSERSNLEGASLMCGRTFKSGDTNVEVSVSVAVAPAVKRQVFDFDAKSKQDFIVTAKKLDPSAESVFVKISGLGDDAFRYTDGYGVLSVNFLKGGRDAYVLADQSVCSFDALEQLARTVDGRL